MYFIKYMYFDVVLTNFLTLKKHTENILFEVKLLCVGGFCCCVFFFSSQFKYYV